MTPFRPRWAFAFLAIAVSAAAAPNSARPRRPRVLAGQLDTIVMVPKGMPFGAAASSRGLAYITLHGDVAALSSWDFAARIYRDQVVHTGAEPTNVSFAPDGRTAFVASQYAGAVERVQVGESRVDAAWPTSGSRPFQTAVAANGGTVFASGSGTTLFLFDASTGTQRGQVSTGGAPNGIAVTRRGTTAYLTHLRSAEIGAVDVEHASYRVLAHLDGGQGQGIVLSKDGRSLFAVSEDASQLCRFDTRDGDRIACVATASGPFGLALTPDGRELWVTTLSGELERFAAPGLTRIATLELGGRLRRIAIDPAGRGAVIADETGRVLVVK